MPLAMFNHAVSEDYIRRNYAHGSTKELGIYNNKREALTLGCIDKKNGGMNTYTGVMIPLFFLLLNSIKNCSFRHFNEKVCKIIKK